MPKAASTRASKGKDAKPVKGKKKGEWSSSSSLAFHDGAMDLAGGAPPPRSLPRPTSPTDRLLSGADPNAPKRGLSAYMFFANDTRDKLRAEQPNLKFGEHASPRFPCISG